MISKKDILKFVKQVHRRNRGIPDRRLIHPHREWLIGLGIFLVAACIGAVVSLRNFEFYKNIDKQSYTVDVVVPSYNQTLAQNVLADYAVRQENYDALASKAPVTVPEVPTDETDELATTTDEIATSTPQATTTEETVPESENEVETEAPIGGGGLQAG